MLWARLATLTLLSAMTVAQEIPAGTVIPIMLGSTVNAKKDKAEKKITGQVMQDVPMPDGGRIKERSPIIGQIVRVDKPGSSGSSVVLRFETIEDRGHSTRLTAALLAVASMASVADAQSRINSSPNSDPITQWVTRQVGGDVVNRGRGKAGTSTGVIGRWLQGSSVIIRLTPNPNAGCPEGPGYDRDQAVWIFSSGACGTYGLGDLKISKTGRTQPLGDITLTSGKNIAIRAGSGWMLIVVANPESSH